MNILDEIVAYKREFIAAARGTTSLDEVRAKAESAPPARGFAKRLRGTRGNDGKRVAQETLRVVAEIKRASPSRGVIREDFNPAGLAASYDAGGASALSVLTDEKFFQGSLDCLIQARQASDLPILRKEFIIDVYQIHEARGAGADCILLIAGILPWGELNALRAEARSVGLEVLLEIHERSEVEPGLGLSPDVLGINNRDLRSADFKTDLSRTEELIDYIPDEVTLMSESGIRDREDVERLARLGVDAILVGEHLMREPDPGEAIGRKLGLGPGGGEGNLPHRRASKDIEMERHPQILLQKEDKENVAQPPSAVLPRAKPAQHRYRRTLPHIQGTGGPLFVTFCTHDRWVLPPRARDLALEHCLRDNGKKIELYCTIVMPDHVHLLYRPLRDSENNLYCLSEILGGIKGASSHSINGLLDRRGHVWQDESFDHVLRRAEALSETIEYMLQNPVRKEICKKPEDYEWLWVDDRYAQPRAAVPHLQKG